MAIVELDQAAYSSAKKNAGFFGSVYKQFKKARSSAGGSDHFYLIGGQRVCLSFAEQTLVNAITPALEHLKVAPTRDPSFSISIFDSRSTGIDLPPPPWSFDDYVARGEIKGANDGDIQAAYTVDSQMLSLLNYKLNAAIFWIKDAQKLPYWETGSPLKSIFRWWMAKHDVQFLHAAAVGRETGCVLLAGRGGSGKSTTALACLNAGFSYLSDDYCLVKTDPEPTAYSIYSSGKINAVDIDKFPQLGPMIRNKSGLETEKALFMMLDHYQERIRSNLPVRAVLIPQVTGRPETDLVKASPAAALKALAVSTIFQLPGAGQGDFQRITRLVKKVPAYSLMLGTDLCRIPEVIDEFCERCHTGL